MRAILTVPEGATLVLVPRPEDADWLNIQRPAVARRNLKVVLWCDAETRVALAQQARDFFDWISHHHEAPAAPAPYAVCGIRAALRARAPGIVWAGGDLEACFKAALPGRALIHVRSARPYAELVEAARPSGRAWIAWHDVDGPFRLQQVQRATAEAGRRTRTVLVEPFGSLPGWWDVHAYVMAVSAARAMLERAGARAPGRLVALVGCEPEGVALIAELLERETAEAEIERTLAQAEDPGAAVAQLGERQGVMVLGAVGGQDVTSPFQRAFGAGPRGWALRQKELLINGQKIVHEHRSLVESLLGKAKALARQEGQGDEAEALARWALEITRKVHGEEHPKYAEALERLGGVYFQLRRFADAEAAVLRAIAILEAAPGTEDEKLCLPLTNLATVLAFQGRYAEANAAIDRVSEIARRRGHERLWARSLSQKAEILSLEGRPDALPAMRDALAALERTLGPEDPETQQLRNLFLELSAARGV